MSSTRPQPPMDIEAEFAVAIESLGGTRGGTLLGDRSQTNADFVFPQQQLVAELKSLDVDVMSDPATIDKASALYVDEQTSGQAPVVVFGTCRVSTDGFRPVFAESIVNLYQRKLARPVKKANDQILKTAEALGYANPRGVLLVANNNNRALHPVHLAILLERLLSRLNLPAVDIAIGFSGNLQARLPGHTAPIDYWCVVPRPGGAPVDLSFIDQIRDAWLAHVSKKFGFTYRSIEGDLATFIRLDPHR